MLKALTMSTFRVNSGLRGGEAGRRAYTWGGGKAKARKVRKMLKALKLFAA
jgi:hypothetical protein